jgi:Leucine-rich repeat (LRR) protein
MMKNVLLFVSILLLILCLYKAEAVNVNFPDSGLEAEVRDALDKPTGPITDTDLASLTWLYVYNDITDLTGIEYCINLVNLEIHDTLITNISPLSGLVNLEELDISDNYVTDISPLANLTKLKRLDISRRRKAFVENISVLANLINLEDLYLSGNRISNINSLSNLTKLRSLELDENLVSDISPLSNLINLEDLYLNVNQISNISSLSNLAKLRFLDLDENLISNINSLSNLINLESLGLFDNQISNIGSLSNLTKLRFLGLVGNLISDINPLANLINLESLSLDFNQISNINALLNLTKLNNLYLDKNQISNIGSLSNLTKLLELSLEGNQINNINALANLVNLNTLELSDNMISDISSLANLTKLEELNLDKNQIVNISPLANLKILDWLNLADNQITNINPLANLNNLGWLILRKNQITTMGPLPGLSSLNDLDLGENRITDISQLTGLTYLQYLNLSNNQITNISSLANLKFLESLNLGNNSISNISPLTNLMYLSSLSLDNNQISNILPLVNNGGLRRGDSVYLNQNPLNDDAYNIHIPALESRGVEVRYDSIARITDLSASTGATGKIIQLAWKAPKNITNACRYVVKYNTTAITESNWAASFDVDGEPIPNPAGSSESMAVTMPNPSVIYYFAIKTMNPAGNLFYVSNSPWAWSAMPSGAGMELYVGWNMVAFMGDKPMSVDEAMSSMAGKYTSVWTYDASISSWLRYIVGVPGFLNNLKQMKPGGAYWIDITQKSIWYFGGSSNAPSNFDTHKPPFLLYGKVYDSTDPGSYKLIEPASYGELNIHLRVGNSDAGNYTLGSNPDYGDYYVLEVPLNGNFHKGDITKIYVDGVLADGDSINLGDVGNVNHHDIFYMSIPRLTRLLQNYPNPFNPETWIPYQLSQDASVRILIYDISGNLVRLMDLGYQRAGNYLSKGKATYWDGTNDAGENVASGVYFYSIQAGNFNSVRKMIITR